MSLEAGPLAATLARLSAADAWCGYQVGRPSGDGWIGVDEILAHPATSTPGSTRSSRA